MRMKRLGRVISFLVALGLVLGLYPSGVLKVRAAGNGIYRVWNSTKGIFEDVAIPAGTTSNPLTVITNETQAYSYFTSNNPENKKEVYGTVIMKFKGTVTLLLHRVWVKPGKTLNIILMDECDFHFDRGIDLPVNSTLNIYIGSTGNFIHGTGSARFDSCGWCNAGIGGTARDDGGQWINRLDCGTVNIYGGHIYAEGRNYAAGIGGGAGGNGGTVSIYGGVINAVGGANGDNDNGTFCVGVGRGGDYEEKHPTGDGVLNVYNGILVSGAPYGENILYPGSIIEKQNGVYERRHHMYFEEACGAYYNGVSYYNVQQAIDAAANTVNQGDERDVIRLLCNGLLNEPISIRNDRITLDLRGYSINASYVRNNAVIVCDGGDLEITDSSAKKEGSIIGGDEGVKLKGLNPKFTLTNGTITGAKGMGVNFDTSGTFTMTGGKISGNCTASHTGAVYLYGTGTITGGEISDNSGSGVVLNDENDELTMSGGKITGNNAYEFNGGGIRLERGSLTMSGGEISGNKTSASGGGIYQGLGTLNFSGNPVIKNNTAGNHVDNVFASSQVYVVGKLGDNAEIGITSWSKPTEEHPVTFVYAGNGYNNNVLPESDFAQFKSDDEKFVPVYCSSSTETGRGKLYLGDPVTVVRGSADKKYAISGSQVTITANEIEGKAFDYWSSEDGVELANTKAAQTTFVMPEKGVTVTANYKDIPVITLSAERTLSFNHKEQTLTAAGSTTGGTLLYAVTTQNKVPDASAFKTTIPTAKEIGTYYVWCKVKGNEKYADVGATGPVVVKIVSCAHKNTVTEGAVTSTCSTPGYSGDVRCTDCGDIISTGSEQGLADHDWGDWVVNGNTVTRVCKNNPAHTETHPWNLNDTTDPNDPVNPYNPVDPVNPVNPVEPAVTPNVSVTYATHRQTYGWEDPWKKDGEAAGTMGESKRLEAIEIAVTGNENLGIQYTTHCQTYGWLPWSANGEMSGTSGESKRLEAIKIQLTGADKDKYDVYYRVHAQTYGWMGWASNGEIAGTAGESKRLEAIQIIVVKKGEAFDVNCGGIASTHEKAYEAKSGTQPVVGGGTTDATNPQIAGADTTIVMYRTHVQTYGWQTWKANGDMSGTAGESKRLEAINIKLSNKDYTGGICYNTHVQTYGWQGDMNNAATWKKDGELCGTSGESKRLEAIQISLYGEMAEHYDIYYRVHAQTFGWLNWAKNGEMSGTAGYSKRLEGIQIILVPKGAQAPVETYNGITSTNYNAFVQK